MSSSDRITQSKGEPKELNLPTRTRQKKKVTKQGNQARNGPTTYRLCRGIGQTTARGSCSHITSTSLTTRPASSQSITGPITGERPCSRALSVVGVDEDQPQSTPPLANHYLQS